jgi:hypothetical protein
MSDQVTILKDLSYFDIHNDKVTKVYVLKDCNALHLSRQNVALIYLLIR